MRACVRACVRARACVCVWVCGLCARVSAIAGLFQPHPIIETNMSKKEVIIISSSSFSSIF